MNVSLEQIDEFHRANPRFRKCEIGYGQPIFSECEVFLLLHARNSRFELRINSYFLNWRHPPRNTNYISLDGGPRIRLTDFASWGEVEAAIKARL